MSAPLIQLKHIMKSFPGVVANDDVSLDLYEGAIHAIIGENGAGKSTLMGILYGRYQPDSGQIYFREKEVTLRDPAAAIALGIGMVTQHTTLIPALTALENVILGWEPAGASGVIDREQSEAKVSEIARRIAVSIDWHTIADRLSVASLQKAEIVKALFRGARILILDEPTATLAPQEAAALFELLHRLSDEGVTIVLVTHKLMEVMEHTQKVTVLRGGKVSGQRETSDTNPQELLTLMLGRTTALPGTDLTEGFAAVSPRERMPESTTAPADAVPVLDVRNLTVLNDRGGTAVRDVSLQVAPGEILGVAGVDGSGQKELAQAIAGLRMPARGEIHIDGKNVTRHSSAKRRDEGGAYIPEDRHREGLILDFTVAENMLLGKQRDPLFGGGRLLDLRKVVSNGEAAIQNHNIRAPGANVAARALSGGNQQKIVVARALESHPKLLVAIQPTRGLDVAATGFIYSQIRRALDNGMGVLFFSLDMDEIMELSHRIAVIFNGEIPAVLRRQEATADSVGRIMLEGRA